MGKNKTGAEGCQEKTNGQQKWKKIKKVSDSVAALKPAAHVPQTPHLKKKRSASLVSETSEILLHPYRLNRNNSLAFLGDALLLGTIKSEDSKHVTHEDESHLTRGEDLKTFGKTQDNNHKKGPRLKEKRRSLAAIYTQKVCELIVNIFRTTYRN
ncbi:hypothetical protein DPMN_187639 [Dreissena polymorpha]|uniref:Uncharacterized protein n=1 Tax=Dreissena polymorpha TaxID=45954 RepID=A0A9D4I988_DREPO|nr:hypothetical protein DPMN_187639 [Dreissena polymorpha]